MTAYGVSAVFVEYGQDPVEEVFPASPSSTCSTLAGTPPILVAIVDHVAVVSVHAAATRRASIGTSYRQSVWVWS